MGLVVAILMWNSILTMTLNCGYGQDIVRSHDKQIDSQKYNARMIHESVLFPKYPLKKKLTALRNKSGFLHKKSVILNKLFKKKWMKHLPKGNLHGGGVRFSAYMSVEGVFQVQPSQRQVLRDQVEPIQGKRFTWNAVHRERREAPDLHQMVIEEKYAGPTNLVFQDVNGTSNHQVPDKLEKKHSLHFSDFKASTAQSILVTKLFATLVASSHFTVTSSVKALHSEICTSVLCDSDSVTFTSPVCNSDSVTFTSPVGNINSGSSASSVENLYPDTFILSHNSRLITTSLIDSSLDKFTPSRYDVDADTLTALFSLLGLEASASGSGSEILMLSTEVPGIRFLTNSLFASSQYSKTVDGDSPVEFHNSDLDLFPSMLYIDSGAVKSSPTSKNEFDEVWDSENNLHNIKNKSIYSCQNCVFQTESSGSLFSAYHQEMLVVTQSTSTHDLVLTSSYESASVESLWANRFYKYILPGISSPKDNGTDMHPMQVESIYSYHKIFSTVDMSSEDTLQVRNSRDHNFRSVFDTSSASSKATGVLNEKVSPSGAFIEPQEVSEPKAEVYRTTSISSVGYNVFSSSSAQIESYHTQELGATNLMSSRTTHSSLTSKSLLETTDIISCMDLPTPELLVTRHVLTSKPIESSSPESSSSSPESSSSSPESTSSSPESEISMSVLPTTSYGTKTVIIKPNDSSVRLIQNKPKTNGFSSSFEITPKLLDTTRRSEFEQSSFEFELPIPEPELLSNSTSFSGNAVTEAQSSIPGKPSQKGTEPAGIPETETHLPELRKPTPDQAEGKYITYEQQNPIFKPSKAEPPFPERTQNFENPKSNAFAVHIEVQSPTSEQESESPSIEPHIESPTTKTKWIPPEVFESEPEANLTTIGTHFKAPTSEARHQQPSNEPEHKRPTSEPEHKQSTSEPKHQQTTSEPEQKKPTSEPKHQQPTSEPKHQQPTSEPKHQQPTSEPKHQQPTSEPEHKRPTSEPKHQQPTSEPKHQQPTSEPKHQQPTSEPEQKQPTSEPKHQQPTSEPKHQQPTSEPKHQQPTSEAEHKQPTSEPKHKQPTSEPKHKQRTSEPEQKQPTSEPKHQQPTSEPEHKQSTSEPEHKQPTSEPEHKEPTSEPEHKQTTSEPKHQQPTSEPEHKQPTSEPEHQQPTSESGQPNPELEGEPETFGEPQPEWDIAKELWKEAWDIHIFVFGSTFILLGITCVVTIIRLWKMEHLLSKHYFLILNVLVILVCFFRGMYLLVDAYNSRKIYPLILDYFLYSIVFPCLTSMFSILFYALLLATGVQALSKKVQKLWMLLAIIFFHFALSITTNFIIGFYNTAGLLLIVCQFFFVLWGLLIFIGYILIVRRLYISAAHRHRSIMVHTAAEQKLNGVYKYEINEHKNTLNLAIKVTFVSAFFGFACIGLQLYGMFGVYGILKQRIPDPWSWWTYHTLLRSMELLMCISISYVAAQPLHYWCKKGQSHTFFYLLPCKLLFCDRDSAYRSETGFNSSSLDHMHLSESSNESHSASRKYRLGNENDVITTEARYEKTSLDAFKIDSETLSRDATLHIRGRHKKSMLIVEDGFVRIRREDEMSSIAEQEFDTYSRSTDLISGSLSPSNDHVQGSYDGSSENNISSCFPSNDEFSQSDHANGVEDSQFSWQIPYSNHHASDSNASDIVLSLSMSDLTNEMEKELKRAFQSQPVGDEDLISNISLPVTLGYSTDGDHQCNVNICQEYYEEKSTPQTPVNSPTNHSSTPQTPVNSPANHSSTPQTLVNSPANHSSTPQTPVNSPANHSSAISTSHPLISKQRTEDPFTQKKLFDSR